MTNQTTTNEYETILYAIGVAFVEIRAADSLERAQILADIFHNIPAMIRTGRSAKEIKSEMLSKAARHGKERTIRSLLDHAEKKFSH